jgi:hypothetical protein
MDLARGRCGHPVGRAPRLAAGCGLCAARGGESPGTIARRRRASYTGSYRDPSGFVFCRDGVLYRQVNAVFADEWAAFEPSGLRRALSARESSSRTTQRRSSLASARGAIAVIRPDEIDFISHAFGWSSSQLKDAALLTLLTLRAQSIAGEHGITLRDASAYNVQFHAGRPLLIDSLSFERAGTGGPWKPCGQFCEHFLAPLALMAHRNGQLGRLPRA